MEEELDDIEEGKLDWQMAMADFYGRFTKDMDHAEEHMTDIKRMEQPTDLFCEKCGKPMVIKWGKHGSFIACTGYPDCTYTRELTVDLPDIDKADLTRAGRTGILRKLRPPMVLKKGRFGSSSPVPDIRIARPPSRSAGSREGRSARREMPAVRQQSGAEVRALRGVHRLQQLSRLASTSSRRLSGCRVRNARRARLSSAARSAGNVLWMHSLSGVRFVAWAKPIPEKCPECGSSYLVEKFLKTGPVAQCPNAECKYKHPIEQERQTSVADAG